MSDQTNMSEHMPALVPSLTVSDPRQTLEWFERLGFRTVFAMEMPDGTIGHCHVDRNGAQVMFGPACADSRPGATGVQLYITLRGEHVDDLHERARQEGLTITMPPPTSSGATASSTSCTPTATPSSSRSTSATCRPRRSMRP